MAFIQFYGAKDSFTVEQVEDYLRRSPKASPELKAALREALKDYKQAETLYVTHNRKRDCFIIKRGSNSRRRWIFV